MSERILKLAHRLAGSGDTAEYEPTLEISSVMNHFRSSYSFREFCAGVVLAKAAYFRSK